jgi:cytolysin (calcineurin-like family phosphatase)
MGIARKHAAFDSQRYTGSRGYASNMTIAWRKLPVEELAKAGQHLLQHKGWEDLKSRVKGVCNR